MFHKCDDCGCVKNDAEDSGDIIWKVSKPYGAPWYICELCRRIQEAMKIRFTITAREQVAFDDEE